MAEQILNTKLVDSQSDDNASLDVAIIAGPDGICLNVKGYGEQSSELDTARPIIIEFYEGKLQILAWTDINEGDPQIIDMEGARESKRQSPDKKK
tara:strand:- start:4191 stop:4475 length:285 start_codon:yes stop_codon:yes gene_type:complete